MKYDLRSVSVCRAGGKPKFSGNPEGWLLQRRNVCTAASWLKLCGNTVSLELELELELPGGLEGYALTDPHSQEAQWFTAPRRPPRFPRAVFPGSDPWAVGAGRSPRTSSGRAALGCPFEQALMVTL